MALLEDLRPNLLEMSFEEASVLFQQYTIKREYDLQRVTITPKTTGKKATGKKKPKGKQVKVNQEQLALLRKLGLI